MQSWKCVDNSVLTLYVSVSMCQWTRVRPRSEGALHLQSDIYVLVIVTFLFAVSLDAYSNILQGYHAHLQTRKDGSHSGPNFTKNGRTERRRQL